MLTELIDMRLSDLKDFVTRNITKVFEDEMIAYLDV
jgi:hypothetical protein